MHIKLDLKVFLFLVVILIVGKIEIYTLTMLYAFVHELGHLLCGLTLGFKPNSITIMPYGFNLNYKINYRDYNIKIKNANMVSLKKIIIYLAGPVVNALIVILCFILEIENTDIVYVNMLIALFNMIPIYPLDGGKILQELIHIFVGKKNSYRIIQIISITNLALITAVSSILILYYKNYIIVFTIVYLWFEVLRTNKYIRLRQKILENIDNYKLNLKY